ncbi:hypothetical protein [Roseibium polysiphoniae]|uniref:hypothetical protein n=1 Tax=Roseibium polysiphoniae TaxID=2571221 RepID=UPI001BD06629|nr:hypothetical protein [Roseibium polysiphoniae]
MTEEKDQTTSNWASLKEELVSEGKSELVEAIELLIQEGRRMDAAQILKHLSRLSRYH